MKRALVAILLTATAAPLTAQQASGSPANPMVGAIAPLYENVKRNITMSADQVSEADYAFKPTPEVRSFGQLVGHVANANYMLCSAALGEQSPSTENIESARTTKAALVEALRASFAYCDRAYAQTDTQAAQPASVFGRQSNRLYALNFNAIHDWEHYGNMVTYMRLKGMVPPSTAGR